MQSAQPNNGRAQAALQDAAALALEESSQYLTVTLAGQTFGLPVLQVQDVLGEHPVTKIPLAPPQVAGSLNLRGRIVTAINVRCCLGLEDIHTGSEHPNRYKMGVVVEYENELFSLIIDDVGDVLSLHQKDFEANPATLDKVWREISMGIYRLDNKLVVILDVAKLLDAIRH